LPPGRLITVSRSTLSYGKSWPDDNVKAAFNWHWEFAGVGKRMEWNGSGNDKPANDNDSGFDFDDHDSSSCTYTGIPAVLLAVGDF